MTDLAARYGAPSPVRRRVALVAIALLAAVALGWLAWAALFAASPAVTSELATFDVVDENTATARIDVALEDGVVASCRVRALAQDHATVGEIAFEPVDGPNQVSLRTERRATAVDLVGCTAPGQPRPR